MKQQILIVISLIFLISLVSADIRVVLTTPQVTFINVTGSEFKYYLGIENKNNFILNIEITPPENLSISFYNPLNFSLEPNESRNINYNGTITRSGNYTESIKVTYSGNDTSFALSSNLIFIVPNDNITLVTEEPVNLGGNSNDESTSVQIKKKTNVSNSKIETINNTLLETNITLNQTINSTLDIPITIKPKGESLYLFAGIIILFVIFGIGIIYLKRIKKPIEIIETPSDKNAE